MPSETPAQTALILGATSDIGRAAALRLAEAGYALQLAARREDALQREQQDLTVRADVPVTAHRLDILETDHHDAFIDALPVLPDVVLCVVGDMGEQTASEQDPAAAAKVMAANYTAPVQLLGLFANRFETRGHGVIVGVSSVAGDRGRATNYIYGSAKAGFTAFLSGLRNRLAKRGVHVVTVKPGFVRTRMTADMALPGPLTAAPDEVGKAITRAVTKQADVVYVRPVWRLIMLIICAIPERIFKRLRI